MNTVLLGFAQLLSLAWFVLGPVFLGRLIKKAVKGEQTTGEVLILAVLGFFTWLWLLSFMTWAG